MYKHAFVDAVQGYLRFEFLDVARNTRHIIVPANPSLCSALYVLYRSNTQKHIDCCCNETYRTKRKTHNPIFSAGIS